MCKISLMDFLQKVFNDFDDSSEGIFSNILCVIKYAYITY